MAVPQLPISRLPTQTPSLALTIADSARPVPDPPDSGIQAWRDHSGALRAYSQTLEGIHWLHLAGIASFCVSDTAGRVEAIREPGISHERVSRAYERTVKPLLLQALGQELLHGSAVETPAGIVALCGESEAGKSTLASALDERGYTAWADDALAFEIADGSAVALPLPFEIHLRPPSALFFGLADDITETKRRRPAGAREPTELAAICVLHRLPAGHDGPVAAVETLPPARAFQEVMVHAYCFSFDDRERMRAMVQRYLELTAAVPCLRVGIRRGLENLPQILDRLEVAFSAL